MNINERRPTEYYVQKITMKPKIELPLEVEDDEQTAIEVEVESFWD